MHQAFERLRKFEQRYKMKSHNQSIRGKSTTSLNSKVSRSFNVSPNSHLPLFMKAPHKFCKDESDNSATRREWVWEREARSSDASSRKEEIEADAAWKTDLRNSEEGPWLHSSLEEEIDPLSNKLTTNVMKEKLNF